MISYEQILDEIEGQLRKARKSQNQSDMREALAAIRALSGLALRGEKKDKLYPRKAQHSSIVMAQPQSPPQSMSSLEAQPLEEEDGSNGSSIFDF